MTPADTLLSAHTHVQAWLAACQHTDALIAEPADWLWTFRRDALGDGLLELSDVPDRPGETATLALSLALDLPPVRTLDDAHALLGAAAELPPGVTLVEQGFATDDHPLFVLIRVHAASVTPDTLSSLYSRLAKAKHFLEDA